MKNTAKAIALALSIIILLSVPVLADDSDPADGITWSLSEGVLTISGTGDMPDYARVNDAPWFSHIGEITSVVIDDGITHVGSYSFFIYASLTTLTLGKDVKSIGEYAFYRAGLTALDTANVETIGNYAFQGNTSLTTLTLGKSLISIGNHAFNGCTGLRELSVPGNVRSLGNNAFLGCSGLNSLSLAQGLESIGSNTFSGCTGLTGVNLPDSVTSVGYGAFRGCTAMETAVIGSGITSVEDNLFDGCTALESIYFKGNAPTSLGASAIAINITIYHTQGSTGWEEFTAVNVLQSLAAFGTFDALVTFRMADASSVTVSGDIPDGSALVMASYLESGRFIGINLITNSVRVLSTDTRAANHQFFMLEEGTLAPLYPQQILVPAEE